MGEQRRDASGP